MDSMNSNPQQSPETPSSRTKPERWAEGTVIETLVARGVEPPRIRLHEDESSRSAPRRRQPVEADLLATSRGRGNYKVKGEIGRDVLSYVLEAEDADLGRTVAMKVLRDEHVSNPLALRVFVQEARVAAQLQHEGILPVYDFGLHPDGRPYYTMKVVSGHSLAWLLGRRKSIAADRRRFLFVFEQLCKAVAYAHGRGVAHCGLDPEHVIVGAQDETQVVHWASARLLATDDGGEGLDTRPIAPPENHAHMAPECARGDLESCDERTDVFALGSILCQILTGKPAYAGATNEEVRAAAGQARLDEAYRRLEECTDVRELAALARNCLVPGQGARPRSAAEVVEALNLAMVSLDERRGQAEFSAQVAQDEARRERRIARRSRILAEGVLLAGLLAAAGVYFHMSERDVQRRTVLADIQQEIECVQFLWSQARSSSGEDVGLWDEAMMAVSRATSHLNEPGIDDSVRSRVQFVAESLKLERAEALERFARAERDAQLGAALGQIGLGYPGETPARLAARFAEAFGSFALHPGTSGVDHVVRTIQESGIRDEILNALDRWALAELRSGQPGAGLLFDVASRADADEHRARLRDALQARDVGALSEVVAALDPMEIEPPTAVLAARALRDQGRTAQAITLLEQAQARTPGDFAVNYELAACFEHGEAANWEQAVRYYTSSLGCRPSSVDARQRLSHALERGGRVEESMDVLRVALAQNPEDLRLQARLGSLHLGLGNKERATQIWRRAVQAESVEPTNLAMLGEELERAGDLNGARIAFQKWTQLAPDDARAHVALGRLVREQGQLEEAARILARAVELDTDWGGSRLELGDLYVQMGRNDQAVESYFSALRLLPEDAPLQRKLGQAFEARKEWDSAALAFKESLILDPSDEETAARLFMLLSEQLASADAAAQAFRQVAEAHPRSAGVLYYLGRSELARGEHEASATALAESVRLRPDDARSRSLLGRVKLEQGDAQAAVAELDAAIRLEPSNPRRHTELGIALARLDRHAEASQAFGQAIALAPGDADLHYRRGSALQRDGKLELARQSYLEAIRLRPEHAEAHCNLGGLFKQEGDYVASLEAYRIGHEMGSKRTGWQHPSGEWLEEAERLVQAQDQLDAVVRGATPPRAPEDLVRLASMAQRKGLNSTSARLYATAMEQTSLSAGTIRSLDRYQAARAAAQAGTGNDQASESLDDEERERWRKTALGWLERELIVLLERNGDGRITDENLSATLDRWLRDPELAVVRDQAALALLPEPERETFEAFWERVREVAR